jgi:hypothetical protein
MEENHAAKEITARRKQEFHFSFIPDFFERGNTL